MAKRLVFGVSVLLSLATMSGPATAAVWSAPTTLQPSVDVAADAVASARGQTIAVWAGNTGVWAALSAPGGGFSEQQLSHASIANVSTRLLAVDARGDALVAWETRGLPNPAGEGLPPGTLYISYRPAGGRFGTPHRVARHTAGAEIGIDGRGVATIVWGQAGSGGRITGLQAVVRRSDGRYTHAHSVVRGPLLGFVLAVNARDDAVLAWETGRLDSPALRWTTRRRGADFAPSRQLVGAHRGAGPFDVGIDGRGQATIVWEGPHHGAGPGAPGQSVNVSTVQAGRPGHGRIERLRASGRGRLGDTGVQIAVDPRGDAAVAWDAYARHSSSQAGLELARRRAGHGFTPAGTVGSLDIGGLFDAAIAPDGSLLVGWERNYEIETVLAPGPQGAVSAPTQVSLPRDGAADPVVAVADGGKGVAVWQDLGPNAPRGASRSPLLLASTPG